MTGGSPEVATSLAVTRTALAIERTLMAWVRTAASLMSFGFTIYKFFQYLRQDRGSDFEPTIGPRGVALVMIGLGVGALLVATIEYRRQLRALYRTYADYASFHRSLAVGVAAVVSGLGVAGFVLVLLRQ